MKKRRFLLIVVPSCLLLFCLFSFLLAPHLLNLYLPRVVKDLPFSQKEISLSMITPWKIRGTLSMANQEQPSFSIPRFELQYGIGSLMDGKIDILLIDSASIHIETIDGRPVIRGLTPSSAQSKEKKSNPLLLPLELKTLIVKNSTLTVHRGLETLNIIVDGSFTFDFTKQETGEKLLTALLAKIQTRGDLHLNGRLEAKSTDDGHDLLVQLNMPDIAQSVHFFDKLGQIKPQGGLLLTSHIQLKELTKVSQFEALAKLSLFRAGRGNIIVENTSVQNPTTIHIKGDPDSIEYSLNSFIFVHPQKGRLDLKGDLDVVAGTLDGTVDIQVEKVQTPLKLQYTIQKDSSLHQSAFQVQTETFTTADGFSVSPVTLNGTLKSENSIISGRLWGGSDAIVDKKHNLEFKHIEFKLPVQYPLPDSDDSPPADFTIAEIHYKGINSAHFLSAIRPAQTGIAFSSLLTSPLNENLKLSCEGQTQKSDGINLDCQIPEVTIDTASLPDYIKLPEELSFSGLFSGKAHFSLKDNQTAATLSMGIHKGMFSFGENSLNDINLDIDFPHLPLIQSSPGQLGTIGSLNLGKVQASDAKIQFRIDDKETIFLEKSSLNWCGGRVEAGGLRLIKNMEELEATLYCDRVGFTELLDQFGIEDAEGQGTLNGRLPILITKKSIQFDDGFLFSTPGTSGIVRFNNTKQLRMGLPAVNQSAYLDYSMKALENFAYNWTKLSFNTQEDELLLTMQLDGKPVSPLPFGYDNSGQIVAHKEGPGIQHPIRLDVNFRLPLQDLFQYGKNLQSIMENK